MVTLPFLCCLSLPARHEADAILSFAQDSTVVGDISTDVVKFALNWTTTRSDYDHLIARTFKDEWVEVHRPVISRGAEDHTLYTRHSYLLPDGVPLSCPRGHDFIRCRDVVGLRPIRWFICVHKSDVGQTRLVDILRVRE